jgi:hypothetical protein
MDNQQVMKVAAVAGLAFLGYRYVYLPYRMQQILAQQAAAAGMTPAAYLAKIGAVGCQALGAYYGVPPTFTGGVCQSVGQAAAGVAVGLPGILAGIGQAAATSTISAGQALGVALPAVGSGVGGLAVGVTGGIAGSANLLEAASFKGLKDTGSLIKSGAQNVAEGVKYISVEPVKLIASAVGTGAKAVGGALAHLNPFSW